MIEVAKKAKDNEENLKNTSTAEEQSAVDENIEAQGTEQQEQAAQWGHSTFGQSAALAAKAGVKRLWLVHYSPMITDPEQQLAQAQSVFPAAECGFDGKRITLHYEENEE